MKKIHFEEIIGASVTIIESNNPSLKGLSGTVIDETKNTLKIRKRSNQKKAKQVITIIKDQCVIMVEINNEKIIVNGKQFVGRAEDKIKKNA